MTTAKKSTAKKPAAKKPAAKKTSAKKATPAKKKPAAKKSSKKTFVETEKFFEEVANKQIAAHADKIEDLIDSIPAQVTVDARGLKSWLRKIFKSATK